MFGSEPTTLLTRRQRWDHQIPIKRFVFSLNPLLSQQGLIFLLQTFQSKHSSSSSSSLPTNNSSTSQVTSNASASASSFIAAHHPEKPSARAIEKEGGGKDWTVSIAIPGSIVLNAQTMELRGWLAGQVSFVYLNIDYWKEKDDRLEG